MGVITSATDYNKHMSDPLVIAGHAFRSRLIVGTGKYKSFQETARALEASPGLKYSESHTVMAERILTGNGSWFDRTALCTGSTVFR